MKHFFKYLLISAVVLHGCGPDSADPIINSQYFPLTKGNYWVYEVNETQYVLGNAFTSSYQMKVAVVDSFQNQENGFTYVLHKSRRNSALDSWAFLETWTARVTISEVVISEGNNSIVHLRFPANHGNKWDANTYNDLAEDEYEIVRANFTYTSSDAEFIHSVEVLQEDLETIIDEDQRSEIYANQVGLVFKKIKTIKYDDNGNRIPQDGIDYIQELVEFGHE